MYVHHKPISKTTILLTSQLVKTPGFLKENPKALYISILYMCYHATCWSPAQTLVKNNLCNKSDKQ